MSGKLRKKFVISEVVKQVDSKIRDDARNLYDSHTSPKNSFPHNGGKGKEGKEQGKHGFAKGAAKGANVRRNFDSCCVMGVLTGGYSDGGKKRTADWHSNDSNKRASPMKCFACGGWGHMAQDCPSGNKGKGGKASASIKGGKTSSSAAVEQAKPNDA